LEVGNEGAVAFLGTLPFSGPYKGMFYGHCGPGLEGDGTLPFLRHPISGKAETL